MTRRKVSGSQNLVYHIVGWLITWLLGLLGITFGAGLLGSIINLVISAIVLMIADRFVKGMVVKGFNGALIAAVAIGVVTWVIHWVLSLFL